MTEKLQTFLDSFLIMMLNGLLYYKKAILDLALLIFLAWCGAVMAASDGLTVEKWNAMDAFAHNRYYIGIFMVIATQVKGFFSTAVVEAKKKQVTGDTQIINKSDFPTP